MGTNRSGHGVYRFLAIKVTVCTNAPEIHRREGFQKQDFLDDVKLRHYPDQCLWQRVRADVRKTLVFGTGSGVYGNHIFSVYPLGP